MSKRRCVNALDERSDWKRPARPSRATTSPCSYLHNQTLPAVDLSAQYGAAGIGGTQLPSANTRVVNSPIIGTSRAATTTRCRTLTGAQLSELERRGQHVAIRSAQLPRDASYARGRRSSANRSPAQLRSLELQIATEVTNAALQVDERSDQRYEAATARASSRRRGCRRNRAGSRSASRPTSSSSRPSAISRRRRTPNCGRCSTTARPLVDFERSQQAPAAGRGTTITTVTGN